MAVLIRAHLDRTTGEVHLRFPFNPELISQLKRIPGMRWNKSLKVWVTSPHGLAALEHAGIHHEIVISKEIRAEIPIQIATKLRPYQLAATEFLVRNSGALQGSDMRTGKTATAIAAATALLQAGRADLVFVTYPASVKAEWERQLMEWAQISLYAFEGTAPLGDLVLDQLRQTPYLFVGCHYEILDRRIGDLIKIAKGKRYLVIGDEIHACKNRKAGRTKALQGLARGLERIDTGGEGEDFRPFGTPVARWALTGTPMRNRNRDLFCLFDFMHPDSMGGYWSFAKAYCDAFEDDMGHWNDKGNSNDEELRKRLHSVMFRVTRAEVASWLPKSDRRVIACMLPKALLAQYRKLEKALAPQVAQALTGDGTQASKDALRQLAQATAAGKVSTAVERAYEHCERGVKAIVFAYFHETLQLVDQAFDKAKADDPELPPHFTAGGWMTPEKRRKVIETWKATPGPAILLANTLSSGVGIDLADAEVSIMVEMAWVPADFAQAEARTQDVHLGKAVTPRCYEYLIVKGTVDEDMAAALLEKTRNIETVVGADAETSGMATALRGSGMVGQAKLVLANTDKGTIQSMITGIRARLLGAKKAEDTGEALAADMAELDDDSVEEVAET